MGELSPIAALMVRQMLFLDPPEHTRVRRLASAAFTPRRDWLNGHLVLARRIDSPRFLRIDTFSPRNVVHVFRLSRPDEVDSEFAGWLAEAYRVGAQEHLRRPR